MTSNNDTVIADNPGSEFRYEPAADAQAEQATREGARPAMKYITTPVHRWSNMTNTKMVPENNEDLEYLKGLFPHLWPFEYVTVANPAPKSDLAAELRLWRQP